MMKKIINLFGLGLAVISMPVTLAAQEIFINDSTALKERIYKVAVVTTSPGKSQGYLANLSDSNLFMAPLPLPFGSIKSNEHMKRYPFDQLEKIEIRRKGAVLRGAWQGALAGLAIGALSGVLSGDDPISEYNNPNDILGTAITLYTNSFALTAGEKALGYGILGAGAGGFIGAILGAVAKKTFIIGRHKQKFDEARQHILERLRAQ